MAAATAVTQGQTVSVTTTETNYQPAGYSDRMGPLNLIVVSGSFQYAVARPGTDPVIAGAGYAVVTTAGTLRNVTVPTGYELRLKGSGGTAVVEVTW